MMREARAIAMIERVKAVLNENGPRFGNRTPPNMMAGFTAIPAARPFMAARSRFCCVCAGVRSGKSTHAARKFLWRIGRDMGTKSTWLRYWCIAPTYALADVQFEMLHEAFAEIGITGSFNAQKHRWDFDDQGFTIYFVSTDRHRNLRARGLDGLWVTEAGALPGNVWHERIYSRLADKNGWAILEGTPEGLNWWHELCHTAPQLGGKDPDTFYGQWATWQNEAVPALVAECEKAKTRLPERYYRREFEADWTAFQGQIYDEFQYHSHVVPADQIPPRATWREIRFGLDWGYATPGAIVVCIRDSENRWYVVDEVHTAGKLIEWWASEVRRLALEWGSPWTIRCDPSRPEHIAKFRDEGIHAAMGADNSVLTGIAAVATALHVRPELGPGLLISAKCTALIKEIQGYQWRKDGAIEEPIKQNDHAVDALRYALYAPDADAITSVKW